MYVCIQRYFLTGHLGVLFSWCSLSSFPSHICWSSITSRQQAGSVVSAAAAANVT
ncbi:hypothetical protein MPTK1_4g10650 [Marchantia polymorpha subsp. ruderalis]|uniref:Uncharacterized protein n=2 Tax=Marchantia polymorpha TaxID=3197 RepID=A0AAF6B8J3_MARPO|nr:hypothetical protein MARPO_0011s0051 [Marchantia polymorpha]BBN08327.1 hypothetical protein Mp_4g10650 [Marchantia polymorpha subsp. ruderalis]|eukprot:PTQ46363.1 hypothetical protein MARPO_0011s0051 [Marchantia polymorpha]